MQFSSLLDESRTRKWDTAAKGRDERTDRETANGNLKEKGERNRLTGFRKSCEKDGNGVGTVVGIIVRTTIIFGLFLFFPGISSNLVGSLHWRNSGVTLLGVTLIIFFYYLRFLAQINGTFMETLLGCCCWRRHIFRLFHPSEMFSHLLTCSYFLFSFVVWVMGGCRTSAGREECEKPPRTQKTAETKTKPHMEDTENKFSGTFCFRFIYAVWWLLFYFCISILCSFGLR